MSELIKAAIEVVNAYTTNEKMSVERRAEAICQLVLAVRRHEEHEARAFIPLRLTGESGRELRLELRDGSHFIHGDASIEEAMEILQVNVSLMDRLTYAQVISALMDLINAAKRIQELKKLPQGPQPALGH